MLIFVKLLFNFALFLASFCLIGILLVYFGFYFCGFVSIRAHVCVLFVLFYLFFKKELEKEQSWEDLKVGGSGRN